MKKEKKKIHSLNKGKRGERELAKIFSAKGFPARRGRQFSGSPDSPDIVVEGLPLNIHFESKVVERGNPYDWLSQCEADAGLAYPVVCHKRNGKDWIAIMPLKDYINLLHMASWSPLANTVEE